MVRQPVPSAEARNPLSVRRALPALLIVVAGVSLAACSGDSIPSGEQLSRTPTVDVPSPTRTSQPDRSADRRSPDGRPTATKEPEPTAESETPTRTRSATPKPPTPTQTSQPKPPTAPASTPAPNPTLTITSTPRPTVVVTPQPSPSPAPVDESGSSPWLWLGLAALAAATAGVIAALVTRRRRRREWLNRTAATADSVRWLNDTYVPSLLGLGTSQQLQQSWQEGSARFAGLDSELTALGAEAPDQQDGAAVEGVRLAVARLGGSVSQLVQLATIGAQADVQQQAAAGVLQARAAVTEALTQLPPRPPVD